MPRQKKNSIKILTKNHMKKLFVMAAALLVSVTVVAQKKELKEIEKQISKGDLNGAKEALKDLKYGRQNRLRVRKKRD